MTRLYTETRAAYRTVAGDLRVGDYEKAKADYGVAGEKKAPSMGSSERFAENSPTRTRIKLSGASWSRARREWR